MKLIKRISGGLTMKKSIIIILTLSVVLLLVAGGTIAWLTAQDSVTNTFTVGKIAITLAEPEWSDDSNKIYPGAVIDKNPTVTVTANSEDCYVYVMIDNMLNDTLTGAVTLDIDTTNWTWIMTNGSKQLYRYSSIVALNTADQPLQPVFNTVTVSTTVVDETNIAGLNNKTIEIKAFAHQSNAITQANADIAAMTHFGLPTP